MARKVSTEDAEQDGVISDDAEERSLPRLLPAKPNETAEEKSARHLYNNNLRHANFRRLGAPRVTRVLNTIRLLSKLAGPSYSYDAAEVARMFAVIDQVIDNAKLAFQKSKVTDTFDF